MSNESEIEKAVPNDRYLGQIEVLISKLRQGKITAAQLDRFLDSDPTLNGTIPNIDEILTVTVDRDRSIDDGVRAGKYGCVKSKIRDENFPRTGSGSTTIEIALVHFGKAMCTTKVITELAKLKLRAADLQELLSLGEQHPDRQCAFPIVALGSMWEDSGLNQCVPYLVGTDAKQELLLDWADGDWDKSCLFAAVPE